MAKRKQSLNWKLIGVLSFVLFCILLRLLGGFTTMQHEYAHVRTAEKYGLEPVYAPSLKTFFGLNFHPAPLDSTKFSLEDQDKIKNMSLEMKESIVLAGINSDMRFMSVFAVISMVLLISASSFYYWAYKKNSYKLFIAGIVCSYLLLLLLCWIFWAVDGVLWHNINNPGADVHKLIGLA